MIVTATLPQYANGNFFIQALGSNISEVAGTINTFGVFVAVLLPNLDWGITILPASGTSYSRFGTTFTSAAIGTQDITDILTPAIPPPVSNGILLKTNGVANELQSILNLVDGANVTITSDDAGDVAVASQSGGGGGTIGNVNTLTDNAYTIQQSDYGKLINLADNPSGTVITLDVTLYTTPFFFGVMNSSSNPVSFDAGDAFINGYEFLSLVPLQGATIYFDGSNFETVGVNVLFQNNGTANGSQTLLNLMPGNNFVISDDGSGNVTLGTSGGEVLQDPASSQEINIPSGSRLSILGTDGTSTVLYELGVVIYQMSIIANLQDIISDLILSPGVDDNFCYLDVDTAANDVTVTLQDPSVVGQGLYYVIKRNDSATSANTCTINTTAGLIDTFSTITLNNFDSIMVMSDGNATWLIDSLYRAGTSVTVTTAKLTSGGNEGSMTFSNGILVAQTQST